MPLLKPEVSRLLEAAKLKKSGGAAEQTLKEQLDDAGLGLSDTLNSMKQIRDFSESESTKTRINETILKLHGVMKEEGVTIPAITIVISDPSGAAINDNPILMPRELHKLKRDETIQ